MTRNAIQALASRLLARPTAPYQEHAVRAEAERFCAETGLECQKDVFGNLFVRVWGPSKARPLVLAAHMDHPGFEVVEKTSKRRWIARFRGGVPDSYFRLGIRVRLMPGTIRARLGRRLRGKERKFELVADTDCAEPPRFAVWDLADYTLRRRRIYARACDDVIGVVSVLTALAELQKRRRDVRVIGLLSRAEEVGFHGALAAAKNAGAVGRTSWAKLPTNSVVISLETSRELPGVKMGEGVIIRVGAKASIFHSDASRFLTEIAAGLTGKIKGFKYQRALMSGGTCEATAFQEFGLDSAAVCVALGNYHNCGENNRIRAEYVSFEDVVNMTELLVSAALKLGKFNQLVEKLPKRLNRLLREAQTELPKNA